MFVPKHRIKTFDTFNTNDEKLYEYLKENYILPISEFKGEYIYIKNKTLEKLITKKARMEVESG